MVFHSVLKPLQCQVKLELDDVTPLLYPDDCLQVCGDVDPHHLEVF